MSEKDDNPFQSPVEASQAELSPQRFQKILWRARLGWVLPLLGMILIGISWTLYVIENRQMDVGFMIAVLACLVLGALYSVYAVFMAVKVPGVRLHAAMAVFANAILICIIGGAFV